MTELTGPTNRFCHDTKTVTASTKSHPKLLKCRPFRATRPALENERVPYEPTYPSLLKL